MASVNRCAAKPVGAAKAMLSGMKPSALLPGLFVALLCASNCIPQRPAERSIPCKTPAIAGSCYWTRGRLRVGNGTPSYRLWKMGTKRVLGIYSGSAAVRLGGEQGHNFTVQAGDAIVIPAGVGHKNLGSSNDFGVVGAYPDGRHWDLLTGRPGERPKADQNIAALPMPDTDPIYGPDGPLRKLWSQQG